SVCDTGGQGGCRCRRTLEPQTASAQSTDTANAGLEFMGRAFKNTYHSMPFACASGLLQATRPGMNRRKGKTGWGPPTLWHHRQLEPDPLSPVLDGRPV